MSNASKSSVKSGGLMKHFGIAFVIALVVYIVFFYFIEHSRGRKGPWRVAFASAGSSAAPVLIINQPQLKISDVRIRFPGQTNIQTNGVIIFDQPRETPFEVPFGKCVFMDGLSKPGTVVMELFGHEIQLLPRALTIDKKEYPWKPESTIDVPR